LGSRWSEKKIKNSWKYFINTKTNINLKKECSVDYQTRTWSVVPGAWWAANGYLTKSTELQKVWRWSLDRGCVMLNKLLSWKVERERERERENKRKRWRVKRQVKRQIEGLEIIRQSVDVLSINMILLLNNNNNNYFYFYLFSFSNFY
jgi:hypothetical protein